MYSILIIDDEPIVKIALRSILPWEEHGFSICGTASNGLEAMSLIEKHQPDVIITDLKNAGNGRTGTDPYLERKNYPGVDPCPQQFMRILDSVRSASPSGCSRLSAKNQDQSGHPSSPA